MQKDTVKKSEVYRANYPAQPFKDKDFALGFHRDMVRVRVLEERLIKMVRTGDGYFWIGGPGEEAFNIALGRQVDKGEGVGHDFLHLHYRNAGTLIAMGEPMLSFTRQMKSSALDPFSAGRNFVSHPAKKEWNIPPVTSTIETQFGLAPGTARAQWRARKAGKPAGISVVVGGDAGTAEGDFASCLIWSSRPTEELPVLMIVTNNHFGISTPSVQQHGEKYISDRGKAFGIKTNVCDGNQPEKVWSALEDAFDYVRSTFRPFLLEINTSRLYGHSSSSGANRVKGEDDCLELFEKKLLKNNWISAKQIEDIHQEAHREASEAADQAKKEPQPTADDVYPHSFAFGEKAGLPGRDR